MSGTTLATDTPMGANATSLSAPEKKSCCEQSEQMPCLSGENSLTTADSRESTALFSGMRAATEAATSFDRRTRLLTASGLIAGTIHMLMHKLSGQQTLDFASSHRDGNAADEPRADW